MISPNGIAQIHLTVRDVAASALLVLALASCTPSADDGVREDRPQYTVSSEAVLASDVELTFASCSLPQQCDLFVHIENKSDRCIAFNDIDLPRRDQVLLDDMFDLQRRMTGYPEERVRQTFIVLQPGDELSQAVDLHAIYDVGDLTSRSLTFRTDFIECSILAGAPGQSFDLASGPITFARAP